MRVICKGMGYIVFTVLFSQCTPKSPVLEHKRLEADVEVFRDEWGIPHIYAENIYDAALVQGYLSARDRLFQMDYTRRLVHGRLAELFGEGRLDDDRMSRVAGFTRIARKTEEYYKKNDPESYRILDAFSSGVNAYIEDAVLGRNGAFLPPEFEKIDPSYVPEPWTPLDTFALAKAMTFELSASASIEEELGAYMASILFPELFSDLIRYQPLDNTFIVEDFPPPLLSVSGIYSSGRTITRGGEGLSSLSGDGINKDREELLEAMKRVLRTFGGLELLSRRGKYYGSNNWVVSGTHTKSGYPMLANDPHLSLDMPPIWWESHISTPEGNVAGVTFPGSPGVVLGHNDYIAWGATVVAADVSDVYKEEVNPSDSDSVKFNGEYVKMEIYDEPIRVRRQGGTIDDYDIIDFKVRVVPHHGPVVNDIIPDAIGVFGTFTMKWTGNDVTTEMTTFEKINRAKNLEDFLDALSYFKVGAQNFVYADIYGNIGYFPVADYPIRNWELHEYPPVLVLPGTGEYEWDGFIPVSDIPHAYNPTKGFIATANNDPVGVTVDNDPFNDRYYIGGFFDYGLRAMRITDRLRGLTTKGAKIGFEEMASIQADVHSGLADKFLKFLFSAGDNRPDLVTSYGIQDELDLLKEWDRENSTTSAGASLFHIWIIKTLINTFGDDVALEDLADLIIGYIEVAPRPLKFLLEGNVPASGKNYFNNTKTPLVTETWEEILLQSLKEASDYIKNYCSSSEKCISDDMSTWQWGLFHRKRFNHPVYDEFSSPDYANDGGLSVVDASDFSYMSGGELKGAPFYQGGGPSMRHVVELVPDNVRARNVLPGGQSGIPSEAHYLDQLEIWLSNGVSDVWGSTREVWTLRSDIEAKAEEHRVFGKGFPAE